MMRTIIITGASSGIGREFALQLDQSNFKKDRFVLIGRNLAALEALENELETKCIILTMDLTNSSEYTKLKDLLAEDAYDIRMLINSAGYGIVDSFANMEYEDQVGMTQVNCTGLTAITGICLPYMRKGARIIQMASSAGFLPQPGLSEYAASKAYVLSFSRALNQELKKAGISVTCVCPGPVETAFFDRALKDGNDLFFKKYFMKSAIEVANHALVQSFNRKEMAVYGGGIKALRVLAKIVPHRVIITLITKLKG